MNRSTRIGVAGAAVGLLFVGGCMALFNRPVRGPSGQATPPPTGADWKNLLDAEHAAAWENVSDEREIFEINAGVLHIFGRYPLRYIAYTVEQFDDFELHLEYRLARRANSGVFFRARTEDPVQRGLEVQVLDDYGKAPSNHGTGAIYDVVTPMFNMSKPAGEWNSLDVLLDGSEIVVRVNGWKVVDANLADLTMPIGKFERPLAELPGEGYLMLQDHGGEVWFRNIYLRTQ